MAFQFQSYLRKLAVVEVATLARVQGVWGLRYLYTGLVGHDVAHDSFELGQGHSDVGEVEIDVGCSLHTLNQLIGHIDFAIG